MKRSGSQSSTSDYSLNILDSEFPSYEDLFYRPPMPMPMLAGQGPDLPRAHPIVLDNRVREDENEGPLRELLDEMRDWFLEHSASEAERRLHKPLPAPPAVERVARKPYVHAHTAPAMAAVDPYPYTDDDDDDDDDDDHQLTPKASNSGLRTRAAAAYYDYSYAHPTPAPVPQMPTASASAAATFPILRRHLADVPHSPFSDAFVDPSPCPSPAPIFGQSRLRPRSSSVTLCAPSSALLTARSEVNLRQHQNQHQHRPPFLQPPSTSFSPSASYATLGPGFGGSHTLLKPAFNKSFSAPNTPTSGEFMQSQIQTHARPERLSHLSHVYPSQYNDSDNTVSGRLAPNDLGTATFSRWSLSTAAQDECSVSEQNKHTQPWSSSSSSPSSSSSSSSSSPPNSDGEKKRSGLKRKPSRLNLGLSFAKFEIMKLLRFPSRNGNGSGSGNGKDKDGKNSSGKGKGGRKRLIVRGVKSGDKAAVKSVERWCEVFGAIDRLTQKPTGEVHVHYRNRAIADRVARAHTQVEIVGAGRISLDCACSTSGRK